MSKKEPSYSRADVEAVATAIQENWYWEDDYGAHCEYCRAEERGNPKPSDIKHFKGCPVLVAQDLLTTGE